jgi:hypothetical protein
MTATDQAVKPSDRSEPWAQLGPCMQALPNDKWRDFVRYRVLDPGHGGLVRSYIRAGFGARSRPTASRANLRKDAHKLSRDQRILDAIGEESRKLIRAGHPEAVAALFQVIRDVGHKDRVRAISTILDRCDPLESKYQIDVTHRTIDPDREAVEEITALRRLGTSREKLLEIYGPNGLDRIEALEAIENARRAATAKVIEHSEASDG